MSLELDKAKNKIINNIKNFIEGNQLENALELIEEYEKIDSGNLEIFSMKGIVNILKGNFLQAEEILKNGLKLNDDDFDINYNLGYLKENYNLEESVFYYKKALRICENNELKKHIKQHLFENFKREDIDLELAESLIDIQKILFIQNVPDIRTNKIAKILADKGIQTDILYLSMNPRDVYRGFSLPYKNIFKMEIINKTIDFINESDYDILFSCNEPDYLSALLSITNKPMIHDAHDMMSLRGDIRNEDIILEYIANFKSDGNIYVTQLVKEIAIKTFNIKEKSIMILDNYILREQIPKKTLKKLSELDGEIHCVYEGGLSNYDGHHRNIKDIFMKLSENRIHIHCYAPFENEYYRKIEKYSKYFHFEGTKEPNELIEDMTKYDVGLTVLNVTDRNKTFLDTTFPNKAWEYLAAGLPILFSDLLSFNSFLEKNNVGEIIQLDENLKKQIERVSKIKIEKDFLIKNNMYMDNYANELIRFLYNVKKSYYKKNKGE